MRSDRWLAVCLIGLMACPVLRAHADAPLRLVLRVASDDDRALLPRLRGQLSDANAQLIVAETTQLEAALPEQLAQAHKLASAHDADAIVWCTSADSAQLHILLPRNDHILTRQLTGSAHGPLNSSELETAALLVRSALIALVQDAELGQPTQALIAANSGTTLAPRDTPTTEPSAPSPTLPPPAPPREALAQEGTRSDSVSRAEPASDAMALEGGRRGGDSHVAAPSDALARVAAPRDGQPLLAADAGAASQPQAARWKAADPASAGEAPAPAMDRGADENASLRHVGAAARGGVDAVPPDPSGQARATNAPVRARVALGAQLAVDGQSSGGQRGVYASAGFGVGAWAASVFGVVSLPSELADEYFALNVARHALGVAIERQWPLRDAWCFGLAAHAGALLLRRTSQAKSSAVVSYPASLIAAFAFGAELALRWLPGRFGVALRVGADVLPIAPRFESASSPAKQVWSVQPRVALGWEAALP